MRKRNKIRVWKAPAENVLLLIRDHRKEMVFLGEPEAINKLEQHLRSDIHKDYEEYLQMSDGNPHMGNYLFDRIKNDPDLVPLLNKVKTDCHPIEDKRKNGQKMGVFGGGRGFKMGRKPSTVKWE